MRLVVQGHSSKMTDSELKQAAHFFSRCLLTKNINSKLLVTVNLVSNLKNSYGDASFLGRRYRPTKFNIRIKSTLSRKMMLRVLAHEMVHVKQWAHGAMVDYVNGDIKFRRQRHNNRWIYKKPWRLPWEQDAIYKEFALLDLYDSWLKNKKG